MKCGKCKQSHNLVSEVRACYAAPSPQQGATDKQLSYIEDMRKALGHGPSGFTADNLTRQAASNNIAALEPQFKALASRPDNPDLHTDRKPALRPAMPHVPDGYYAIRLQDTDNVKFYRVSHRNAYLVLQVQASDMLHKVGNYALRVAICKAILSDISGARALYAAELGRCYVCGRTLTDEQSRASGIGPVCAARSAA